MDIFEIFVRGYLGKKEHDSKQIAHAQHKLRSPLPIVGSAKNNGSITIALAHAVNEQCAKLKYKLDPLGGVSDYYNHPETTQYRLDMKNNTLPCDCDDFAVYAVGRFRKAGAHPLNAWVWNLIIDPMSQFTQAWANHVICGFALRDAKGQTWTGIIDTNTAARDKIFWFKGDKDKTQDAIIKHFRNIYKRAGKEANYYKLIEAKYPF